GLRARRLLRRGLLLSRSVAGALLRRRAVAAARAVHRILCGVHRLLGLLCRLLRLADGVERRVADLLVVGDLARAGRRIAGILGAAGGALGGGRRALGRPHRALARVSRPRSNRQSTGQLPVPAELILRLGERGLRTADGVRRARGQLLRLDVDLLLVLLHRLARLRGRAPAVLGRALQLLHRLADLLAPLG